MPLGLLAGQQYDERSATVARATTGTEWTALRTLPFALREALA